VNINLTLIGQMLAFVAFVVFCMKLRLAADPGRHAGA
jgi:F0F1-type ATP synthase membrane subunit b/b'